MPFQTQQLTIIYFELWNGQEATKHQGGTLSCTVIPASQLQPHNLPPGWPSLSVIQYVRSDLGIFPSASLSETTSRQDCIHRHFTLCCYLVLTGFPSLLVFKDCGLLVQIQNWAWADHGYAHFFWFASSSDQILKWFILLFCSLPAHPPFRVWITKVVKLYLELWFKLLLLCAIVVH